MLSIMQRPFLVLVLLPSLARADWTEGLTYYYGFEDSLMPTVAGGARAAGAPSSGAAGWR